MSFLARYWNAVERAVSETGMNPGDIVIDLTKIIKNTEDHDDVELDNKSPPKPNDQPAVAGPMPQYKPDIEAKEILFRRLARSSETINQLEEAFERKQSQNRPLRNHIPDSETRRETSNGATKKEKRKLKSQKKKQLRKLGGGRKVRIVIDEVRVNDRVLWSAPGPNG